MEYIKWEDFKSILCESIVEDRPSDIAISQRQTIGVPPGLTGVVPGLWYRYEDVTEDGKPKPGTRPQGMSVDNKYVPWNPRDPKMLAHLASVEKSMGIPPSPDTAAFHKSLEKPQNAPSRYAGTGGGTPRSATPPSAPVAPPAAPKHRPAILGQTPTHVTPGGDADVKQFIITHGYKPKNKKINMKGKIAQGDSASTFNEIVSGEVIHILRDGTHDALKDDPEKLALELYKRYADTGLGKELTPPKGSIISSGPATGLNRFFYTKCLQTAHSGILNNRYVDNTLDTMGWGADMANIMHFYGGPASLLDMQHEIESASKIYSGGGEVLDKEYAKKLIPTMGGGKNSADTAIFIKNHDGSLAIRLVSNKNSTSDVQNNSTSLKELKDMDDQLDSNNITPEIKKEAKKLILKGLQQIQDYVKSSRGGFGSGPQELLNDPAMRSQFVKSLSGPLKRDADIFNTLVLDSFDPETLAKGGRTVKKKIEMLKLAGWDGESVPDDDMKVRAYLHSLEQGTANQMQMKLYMKAGEELPNLEDPAEIQDRLKQDVLNAQFNTIQELNTLTTTDGIKVGNYVEGQKLKTKLHLDSAFDDNDDKLFQTSGLFTTNMGGVSVGKKQLQHCLKTNDSKDFVSRLSVGQGKEREKRDKKIKSEVDAIVYFLTDEGEKVPIAVQTTRSKEKIGTSLATTYRWHDDMQNCFKKNQ